MLCHYAGQAGGGDPRYFFLKKKTIATMQGREPGPVTPLQIEPQSRWRIIIGVTVVCKEEGGEGEAF